jgi:hypothetical protein
VTTYQDYRYINNTWIIGDSTYIIAGIEFKTNFDKYYSLGYTNGTAQKEEFKGYSLGFVHGQFGSHIDSLGFVWYKRCLKNSTVFE